MMSAQPDTLCQQHCRLSRSGEAEHDELAAFVAQTFWQHYQARPDHFLPWLLGEADQQQIRAVLGVRLAEHAPLYLEQYLDESIEQRLACTLGRPVARTQLAEIGNLAAHDRQAGALIRMLVLTMQAAGRPWVVFTATRRLGKMLGHMGLQTIALAPADPACLPPEQQQRWGSYYAQAPWVTLGLIEPSYQALAARLANQPHWTAWQHLAHSFAERLRLEAKP
ncbi:thermostable hemolysin [Aquitalea sp. S1-19]|nr:thermostable hemolysin [Aquitalea sp. S1-19]